MSILVDIEKNFGAFSLKVQFSAGDETLALLGASGCGKSLTLKCIAGIETPDRGRIEVDGVTLFDSKKGVNLTPQQRRTGLMFQNYALFPHMTVRQNIAAGARRETARRARNAAVEQVMESLGVSHLAHRYPRQLSGGEQQRVALARILVSGPRILLLDEPFSALDSHLRFRLEQELRETIRSFGKTVLLVSHDRDEVYRLSHSIAVINRGRVDVFGTKEAVFRDPKTITAATLTGCKNISAIEKVDDFHLRALDWGVTLRTAQPVGSATAVGIRMHDIALSGGENECTCQLIQTIENPFSRTLMLRPDGARTTIGCETAKDLPLPSGEMRVSLPAESLLLLQE